MSFVPVNLSFENRTIAQLNDGDAFLLAPLCVTIVSIQASTVTKPPTRRDCFNGSNLAEQLKLHAR